MNIHHFVHVGDLHLAQGPRQADRLRAFDQIIVEGRALPTLAAWLLPGDLYDHKSSVADRTDLITRILAMAAVAPVCIAQGNHCQSGDLAVLRELRAAWPIYVSEVPEVYQLKLATGQAATVFALPWPTEAGLVSQGVSPDRVAQVAREELEKIFIHAGQRLEHARKQGDITLMIGHANCAGAKLKSVGQPTIGAEISIDQSLISRLGHCYVGLNHIHIAQQVGSAYYAGSVCRLSWGECENKSWNLVSYDDDGPTAENRWTCRVQRRPIDVAPMFHVECDLSRAGAKNMRATAGPDGEALEMPSSWKGTEVRCRAKYHQSEGSILEAAQAHVKAQFAEALRFEFEPICVPDRALRAPEVAVARTLGEKLRAWATVAGVVLPEDAAAKAEALDGPESDRVVADVEQRMAALVDFDRTPAARESAILPM